MCTLLGVRRGFILPFDGNIAIALVLGPECARTVWEALVLWKKARLGKRGG